MERIILRAFGFILHVEHPHKFVLNYVTILEQHQDPEAGLLQRTWNLANDRYLPVTSGSLPCLCSVLLGCGLHVCCDCSLRTTLCVQYKAETVACGLIFMAARQLKVCMALYSFRHCVHSVCAHIAGVKLSCLVPVHA